MTPTQVVVHAAESGKEVIDSDGRRIHVKRLLALDKLRLFKAVGPSLAQNEPYLGMAVLASSVTSIDGVPIPPPVNETHIEGMVSRLGDAGLTAVAAGLAEMASCDAARSREFAGN
jgi:hypothetical protein